VANTIIHPYRRDLCAPQDDIFTSAYNGLPSTVREACRLMEEAIQEPLKIEDISDRLGLSRRHLDRMFCSTLKCSTSDYYRKIRLARARKLVKATKIDFSTISTRCGFNSYSHFLQRYREAYGVSPTEDRSSHTLVPTEPTQLSPLNDLHPYQNQLDPIRMI